MPLLLFLLLTFQNLTTDPVQSFARLLISAETESERASLLQQWHLVGVPLREALIKEATSIRMKGDYLRARMMSNLVLKIATSIQDQTGIAML